MRGTAGSECSGKCGKRTGQDGEECPYADCPGRPGISLAYHPYGSRMGRPARQEVHLHPDSIFCASGADAAGPAVGGAQRSGCEGDGAEEGGPLLHGPGQQVLFLGMPQSWSQNLRERGQIHPLQDIRK